MSDPDETVLRVARMRWRAAEDRLYPSLLGDPGSYQRSMTAMQAVVAELRRRGGGTGGLLAAEAAAFDVVAAACPDGAGLPPELLVAVACGTVDRELTAAREQRRRSAAMDAARAAGRAWAVVDGPQDAAQLQDGRMIAVHLASGAVVIAAADPWGRDAAYGLEVTPDGESRTFADRDEWLAALADARAGVERGVAP
ncbi:MAG: hypothetical protein ACT4RN_01035 [Pseudonocardia sp.]